MEYHLWRGWHSNPGRLRQTRDDYDLHFYIHRLRRDFQLHLRTFVRYYFSFSLMLYWQILLIKLSRKVTLYDASKEIFFLLFIIEPQEKNETEKILPFKLWFDFPYHSPYYEITYTIQVIEQCIKWRVSFNYKSDIISRFVPTFLCPVL